MSPVYPASTPPMPQPLSHISLTLLYLSLDFCLGSVLDSIKDTLGILAILSLHSPFPVIHTHVSLFPNVSETQVHCHNKKSEAFYNSKL